MTPVLMSCKRGLAIGGGVRGAEDYNLSAQRVDTACMTNSIGSSTANLAHGVLLWFRCEDAPRTKWKVEEEGVGRGGWPRKGGFCV